MHHPTIATTIATTVATPTVVVVQHKPHANGRTFVAGGRGMKKGHFFATVAAVVSTPVSDKRSDAY